ncbi:MAG: indole-3-glycerol phosphate synthase TrpC [Saprospiraceae bacterium]
MYILDKIVQYKRDEIKRNMAGKPISILEKTEYFKRTPLSLSGHLNQNKTAGIIAEYKRKSPSKSNINLAAKAEDVMPAYAENGASAISCLTDEHFFGGHNDYLTLGRKVLEIPILRKDFIINEYQIIEAKSIGADAILLIAEVLTSKEIISFTNTAKNLGLSVLLELHHEKELDKIDMNVDVIGINNRDLRTFIVDFNHSKMMFDKLPSEIIKISESGISDPDVVKELRGVGFRGFLIGEYFMKTDDPGRECGRFINALREGRKDG